MAVLVVICALLAFVPVSECSLRGNASHVKTNSLDHNVSHETKGLIRFNLTRRTSRSYGGSPAARASLIYPNGLQYLAKMTVSGVDFWMSIDTGSSFFFVPGKNASCEGFPCNTTLPVAVPEGALDFFAPFGGGGVRGRVFNASVTLAELNFNILAGAANTVMGWVRVAAEQDGLVGLGFPGPARGIVPDPDSRDVYDVLTDEQLRETNMILQLHRAGHLQSPMFSLMLPPRGVDGELILGGVDESIYTCGMVKSPVIGFNRSPVDQFGQNQFWTIGVDAAYMGQKSLPLMANGTVLIDSGFFSINLAVEIWKMFIKEVVSLGIPMTLVPQDPSGIDGILVPLVPCAKLEEIPALTFSIGGVEHHLSAQQMALQDMDTMHAVLHGHHPPFPIGEGTCMLAITPFPSQGKIDIILGQPFLHTVYTAFSMEDPPHIAIGKLECSDDKGDDNFFGKVISIVLGAVFLGILLRLFLHPFSGKVMSIVLGAAFLGILLRLFLH